MEARELKHETVSPEALVDVRVDAHNGFKSDIVPRPKNANSGLMHRSKQRLYSITSSARVRRQLNSTTITWNGERLRALPYHRRERLFKCVQFACFGRDKCQPQRPGGVSRRLQTLQIGRKVRRCATIGGKTAQISQGRHRFGRADGKGLGQHPSLDLP
jgi:hypothetical protein